MKIEQSLGQKQELKLSQDLRQAINILSYDIIKLAEAFENEAAANPVLDVQSNIKKEVEIYTTKEFEEPYETNYNEEDFTESDYYKYNYVLETIDIKDNAGETLHENLLTQLNVMNVDKDNYNLAIYMIDNIDIKGYLTKSVVDIAEETGYKKSKINEVLGIIQSFYPVGVAARNLPERIILQLKNKNIYTDDHKILLKNYLKEIAYDKIEKISKDTGLDKDYIRFLIEEIKSCSPNITNEFAGEEIIYITPEVILEENDGEYEIYIKDDLYPILRKNSAIIDNLENLDRGSQEYKKTKENIKAADFYIQALNERKQNLLIVSKIIFSVQKDFLKTRELNPLSMEYVANESGLSISTISRIATGKYVKTPLGVYPLKFFFKRKVKTESGSADISDDKTKNLIKKMIDNEDKKKPLSDDKISKLLKEDGISISRRTVAKYRDNMDIPSSYNRKKE